LGVFDQGYVSVGGDLLVFGAGGSFGDIQVRDAGSVVDVTGALFMGSTAGSEMQIQNGGSVSVSTASIGLDAGDWARVNLNGPDATLVIRDSSLEIGSSGEGVLN